MIHTAIFNLIFILTITNAFAPCPDPRCDTDRERALLWAHEDPYKFWKCQQIKNNGWQAVEGHCAPGGLFFSYPHQVCVHIEDWVDTCGTGIPSTTEAPTTTMPPETTEIPTTTPEPPFTTTEPPYTTPELPTSTTESPSTTSEPPFTTTEPHTTTVEPLTSTSTDYPSTEPPYTTPELPTSITESPTTTPEPPITTSEPPTSTNTDYPSTTDVPTEPTTDHPVQCVIPECISEQEQNKLLPHTDVSKFWQCIPDTGLKWIPIERECPSALWFCRTEGICIWPRDWTRENCGCLPEQTNGPDPIDLDCRALPNCNKENLLTLWPHLNSISYWRCELFVSPEGATWRRVQKKCLKNSKGEQMKFNFKKQKCVSTEQWEDYCVVPTDPSVCGEPNCYEPELYIKFAHQNPRKWYSCISRGKYKVNMCPFHYLFDFGQQRCVEPCFWKDQCTTELDINV